MLDGLSVEELFNKMVEDVPTGKEKDASFKNAGALIEQGTLDRINAEVSDEELLKQAAVGKYLADTIIESLEKWASTTLMEKIAVGTSNAISGYLRESESNPNAGVDEIMRSEDRMHKDNSKGRVAPFLSGDEVHGAVNKGGGGMPEGGDGVAVGKINKLSRASMVHKIKKAMLEDDLARYQELEAKEKSGAISPEEQAELQELEQKLMALAQQQGGQGAGAPGAGAPQPDQASPQPQGAGGMGGPEGGMQVTASRTAKVASIKELLNRYFPE